MSESSLLRSANVLRVVLDLHAVTLLVAAVVVGWNAEVCEVAADTLTCERSWLRTVAWWAAGGVSGLVPYALGRFILEAAHELDRL